MKHKLQTLLKHKLQWLLLLAALLGVSQGMLAATRTYGGSERLYFKMDAVSWWIAGTNGDGNFAYFFNDSSGKNAWSAHSVQVTGSYYYIVVPAGTWEAVILTRNNTSTSPSWNNKWNQTGNIALDASKNYISSFSENSTSATWGYYAVAPSSCSMTLGGSHSGSGTSADPYIVSPGESLTFTITATHADAGMTGVGANVNATGSKAGSAAGTSVTVSKTASSTAGTNENWTGYAWAYKNSTSTYSSSYATSSKIYTRVASACTTPTNNDIAISAPASTTTLYLGTGSAPSVTQTVTATCSKGNTYLWSATPTSMSYTGAWGAGTATRAAFTSSGSKSTTATFYHEGVYTATFAAGCGNTTDASKNAPTITVKPGNIYFDGPFFSGSGYDLTKHHVAINTSTSQFVYEWTAAYTTGDFVISVGNACSSLATSAYTIGNYADITKTGVSMGSSGNHNFSPNIGTINVGDRLKLTVTYNGVNASSKPQYAVKLEKVCSNPTAQAVSGTAAICSGSSTNVTVASSQSGYTYKLYKGGSATATTKTGTGSALNFPVSEAGTYTVHAYYTSGSDAYCKADMTGSATVTVTPTASIGSVTLSSSSVCIGQGLSATANSVELGGGTGAWSSSNTSIATVSSTGTITPKAAGSANITYTITGGCGGTVSKYATLTVKPNAAAAQYTLTNNTQTYNGAPRMVTVTPASGAGTATIYYTGTGGTSYAKSTTAPINAGTYAITVNAASGTNYCAATNLSVGTLTINKANQSTLTISNTATDLVYCDAANVKLTTSGGSGDGAVTYTVTSGSGSVDGDVLSPSAKGSVSVTATKAASQNFNATTSAAKTFNFNIDAPNVYELSNVGGATTICGDPSSGAGSGTLRLANSQTGYKYQLYSNGAPIEGYAAKAGTGSSIDFPVTSSGTYTVYAYYGDNSTNCPTLMDGEITLTISTQPRLVRSAASVTQYMPVTITSVSTDIAEWKITDNTGTPDLSSSTAYLFDQTYDAISFKGASTNGSTAKTYTIQATTAGGCSETTTVTVNPDTESCGG